MKRIPHPSGQPGRYIQQKPCGGCKKSKTAPSPVDQSSLMEVLYSSPQKMTFGEESGIIYCGGGKYWPGIVLGCRLIRELGCNLPIEVWYQGSEVEPVYPSDIKGLGVSLFDTSKMPNPPTHGWTTKAYALKHTELNSVIVLDADAYPVTSPCKLLPLLDIRPFCFWEDFPSHKTSIKWDEFAPSLKALGSTLPPVQGGQLIINRLECASLLTTFSWVCENHHQFWPGKDQKLWKIYGDQDVWRIGLAAGSCGWMNLGRADWVDSAFVCSHLGKPQIVHRCQSKLFPPSEATHIHQFPKENEKLPLERRVFTHYTDIVNKTELSAEKVFNNVYKIGIWGEGSGAGSSEVELKPYWQAINSLISANEFKTIVDLGSGDGRAIGGIRVRQEQLTSKWTVQAFDVVNKMKYYQPNIRFTEMDFYREFERIPSSDLLLCKDVLHHWPSDWIVNFLEKLNKALSENRWKMAVLTMDHDQDYDGKDCVLGAYRGLNPTMRPLNQFKLIKYNSYLHKSIYILGKE